MTTCGTITRVNVMPNIQKINKKLDKAFNGMVTAHEDGGRLILSGELSLWADVVRAGAMSVDESRYIGLVNDIKCTGEKTSPPRRPKIEDSTLDKTTPDVLIIGGGVIGCAIARELSRYKLDVMLVEKECDLAMQTSGRNDGMVHSGVDLKKGTQKYHYNMRGNKMFEDICSQLDVEFKRQGQYICFNKIRWKPLLYASLVYWKRHGLSGVRVVGSKKLREVEPSASKKISAALFFPATGIVCPYELTIAYAENAVQNGASVHLNTMVLGMKTENGCIKHVTTNRGTIYPRLVVNATGVFSDDIAGMAGDRFFTIHPRKGTNLIIDKKYGDAIVNTAVSSMETAAVKKTHSKGGAVIRTIDGNILVGPDAIEIAEKEDFTTSRFAAAEIFRRQSLANPALEEKQVITYFSGIRASTYEEDFVVGKGKFTRNILHAAGIQSPGLTAAPAIGEDIAHMAVELLGGEGKVEQNPDFDPIRKIAPRAAKLGDTERAKLIEQDPDFGVVVCRCEEISKGEILDALRRSVPCDTIDGVKRRVRPGMGRCQGGFCGPLVLEIIANEKGLELSDVKKSGDGSPILYGPTKG